MNKGILSAVSILVLVISVSCNKEKNREIFNDFEGEEGIYMIKLPPSLFMGMMDKGAELEKDEMGSVNLVKILFFDENKTTGRDAGDITDEITRKFDRFGYEMALQFSSSGNNISAWLLENDACVSDLMILINGDEGLFALGLSGRLDGRTLMRFASNIDYNAVGDLIDIEDFSL